jgi:uncharacterized RDD family membrane protein YckC
MSSCPRCGGPAPDAPACPSCGLDIARYLAYVEAVAPPPPLPAGPPAPRPGGLRRRAAAAVLDYLLVLGAQVAWGLLAILLWGRGVQDSELHQAATAAFPLAAGGAYVTLAHWLWGQTAGKMLLGLRVEARDEHPPALGRAALRTLVVVLSFALAGLPFLVALLRPDRRALHDLLAGTRVVREPAPGRGPLRAA